MNETENSQERYYERVKERHLWLKFGLILFAGGFGLTILSVSVIFFNGPFAIVRVGTSIGVGAVMMGGFSIVLFGQLGWSESKLVDLLLNRLSIVLIISTQILAIIHLSLGHSFESIQTESFVAIIGIVLALLGIVFHSPINDDLSRER